MIKFLLVFDFLINIFKMTILSKSNIEMCTQSDTLNCTTKLVLSLSIENAKMSDTDYLDVFVNQITDQQGDLQTLQDPYRISISKSAVSAKYPCIYLQDFNYKAQEQIIITDVFSCSAGALASSPTCGWQFRSSTPIPYSQGFCCKCDFSQIIGVDSTTATRGTECSLLNLGLGSATAHCLRFDPLWFSAYEIGQYTIDYLLNIYVTSNSTQGYVTDTISLSPSNTFSKLDKVTATLIGDFQPPTPPKDFSNLYLVVPSYPVNNTMVVEGVLNWMVIPQSAFTLDGTECNKIGVSYYAFNSLTGCNNFVGDCLNNQIYDFYLSDVKKLAAGLNPSFVISQDKTTIYNFFSFDKNNKLISYNLQGVFNTLVSLEINGDDIRYVVNVSEGRIDYVQVNQFQSLSNDGVMQVQVTNVGSLTANFYLSYNCSDYVLPLPADQVSLASFQSANFSKSVFIISQDDRSHLCNVTLKDSVGNVDDWKVANFNTTATVNVNIQSGTNETTQNNNVNATIAQSVTVINCDVTCGSFFDYLCFVWNGCWSLFARTTAVIILLLAIIIILIKMLISGCLCKTVDKLFECLFRKK